MPTILIIEIKFEIKELFLSLSRIFYHPKLFFFSSSTETPESWTGRWFPERPVSGPNPNPLKMDTERPPMGVEDPNCDDAKTNLTLDWDNSFLDYTCDDPRNRIEPDHSIVPMVEYENIPIGYEVRIFL